jgi:hypothetical protein
MSRADAKTFKIGDKVITLNRRKEYKSQGELRVAKFIPRFDGPYLVVDIHEEASMAVHSKCPQNIPNIPHFAHQTKMMIQNGLPGPWRNLDLSSLMTSLNTSSTRSSITKKLVNLRSNISCDGLDMVQKIINGYRDAT